MTEKTLTDVETYIGTIEAHGGPAHPCAYVIPGGGVYQSPGMSLRDWFAGQALAGLMSAHTDDGQWTAHTASEEAAEFAYAAADAMLKAREDQK